MDETSQEVKAATQIVATATRMARSIRREAVRPTLEKTDRSPVTVADLAVQVFVSNRLLAAYPDDTLVSEESSEVLRRPGSENLRILLEKWTRTYLSDPANETTVLEWLDRGVGEPSERFWVLDPIDGTKGFLRGGHYAVALALILEGKVEVGVLGCPHWDISNSWQPDGPGSLVIAVRGHGSWWKSLGKGGSSLLLHVSRRHRLSQARLLQSVEADHTDLGKLGRLAGALGVRADPVSMDSQAKYAVMAAGQGDLLVRLPNPGNTSYKEKIWDQAAGSLIVQEAGGRITDLDGRDLDFSVGRTLAGNRGIVASNGLLHSAALRALRALED